MFPPPIMVRVRDDVRVRIEVEVSLSRQGAPDMHDPGS